MAVASPPQTWTWQARVDYHNYVPGRTVAKNPWIVTVPTENRMVFLGLPTEESLYSGALGEGRGRGY